MTRCPLCTFLSLETPCEVCASGIRVRRIGVQEITAQLDALCPVSPPAPKAVPRQRPARKAALRGPAGHPCGRCGVLMPWSLGRARVVARGQAVYCDDCKMPHQLETQRAYHRAHYQPITPRKESTS